jgi:hypothetical protein
MIRCLALSFAALALLGCDSANLPVKRHERFPSIGTCYDTKVKRTGGRFHWNDTPPLITDGNDDDIAVEYVDGQYMMQWGFNFRVSQWRKGDPVRLCVIGLPENCPPGDDRGVEYRARNNRTGESWVGFDSAHLCGGA